MAYRRRGEGGNIKLVDAVREDDPARRLRYGVCRYTRRLRRPARGNEEKARGPDCRALPLARAGQGQRLYTDRGGSQPPPSNGSARAARARPDGYTISFGS